MHNRIDGIDYLRAAMSVFVVLWHMGGGGKSLIFSRASFLEHVFTLSDLVNFHLLLLAVPVFILVSNFLYASKPVNKHTLRKRIKRIIILLTFWPLVFIIGKQGIDGLVQLIPNAVGPGVIIVLGAGNTIYYFFVCLLASTVMSHFIVRLNIACQLIGGMVSIVFLACLPWMTLASGFYPLSAYWSPLNVIPFSFAAVLVAQNRNVVQSNKFILLGLCGALAVLSAVLEWHYAVGEVFFMGQGFAIPAYTRTSLLFSAVAILIIAIDERIKSNVVIHFMARHSLALYCIHPFLIDPVQSYVSTLIQNDLLFTYSSIVLVMLCSYSLAIILRLYLKQEVIT